MGPHLTSIEIKVYRNNKKVKSSQKTIEDPYDSYTLDFEYTLGEEESSTKESSSQ